MLPLQPKHLTTQCKRCYCESH